MPTARSSLWTIAARLSRNATLLLVAATLAAAEPAPFISDADWNQPKAAPAAADGAAPASPGRALATMGVALAVILGLGVGSVVLIRRLGGRRRNAAAPRHVSLVETLPLGLKRSVALLRIGDHVVLVGSHEHGLTGLGVLPASALAGTDGAGGREPGAVPAAPASPAAPVAGTGAAFAAVLENLMGRPR
jgi:flagellar biogenesis protein FliO